MSGFFRALSSFHTWVYRLSVGRWGGRVQRLPVLLLTTIGRRSGQKRTTPLGYFQDGGRYVIIASNSGRPRNPGWFHNLEAHPDVDLRILDRDWKAHAHIAQPLERDRLWARLIALSPGYAAYARRTRRNIPLVILDPASP